MLSPSPGLPLLLSSLPGLQQIQEGGLLPAECGQGAFGEETEDEEDQHQHGDTQQLQRELPLLFLALARQDDPDEDAAAQPPCRRQQRRGALAALGLRAQDAGKVALLLRAAASLGLCPVSLPLSGSFFFFSFPRKTQSVVLVQKHGAENVIVTKHVLSRGAAPCDAHRTVRAEAPANVLRDRGLNCSPSESQLFLTGVTPTVTMTPFASPCG